MYLNKHRHRNHQVRCLPHVRHHHIICEHQIEIEIWPENAEVYFKNERYVDPVNTRIQFDSAIFNAPTNRVRWEVFNEKGEPGEGSINSSGLYIAPDYDADTDYGNYTTDIVVATSIDDPTRKATAIVNIVGVGPEPEAEPVIEIFPKVVHLYCRTGHKNNYIDNSNKVQQFRTIISNSTSSNITWTRSPVVGSIDNGGFYRAPNSISEATTVVTVEVSLNGTSAGDEAKIILANYKWPA
ncbi:MAG: hypothetical protein OEV42_03885 [Deltaproteobacteria bacterium]|nr:hypothetical protein [Deltaproteobacteria bacterium]